MDHMFQTRRALIDKLGTACQLLEDAALIASAPAAQRSSIRRRCEAELPPGPLRDAVTRNAFDLGRLLRNVDALEVADGLGEATHAAWTDCVLTDAKEDGALLKDVRGLVAQLTETRARLLPDEEDEGSSSYSDYTATETSSSGDDEEEGEEEEEEEEDTPPHRRSH